MFLSMLLAIYIHNLEKKSLNLLLLTAVFNLCLVNLGFILLPCYKTFIVKYFAVSILPTLISFS